MSIIWQGWLRAKLRAMLANAGKGKEPFAFGLKGLGFGVQFGKRRLDLLKAALRSRVKVRTG